MKVVNRGGGAGNGLIAAVVTDEYRIETTTNQVMQRWYWTAEEQQGLEWTTADPEDDSAWQTVQRGSVERDRIQDLLDAEIEVVSGFRSGIDVGTRQGSLILSEIRGQNLALDKPSNRIEVVDGKLNSSWDPPITALNYSATVDLQVRRNVSSVRVVTRGSNPGQLEENSLKGYSVQVSDDQVRWTEVGVIHDIEKYDWTEVHFTPVWTRYVRIVIVDINSVSPPKVAEVEVYGDGYTDEGTYLSEPLSLGAPDQAKNFGRVRWDAEIPARTDLFVQFRTGNSVEDFEDPERGWSAPLSGGDVWFPASEPGAWLQYRVALESRDQRRTPALHSIGLDYTTEGIAVSGAHSRVTPNRVSMGADTLFVCTLDLAFAPADAGIERLRIAVPSEARLVDDGGQLQEVLAGWTSTQDALELSFFRAAPRRRPAADSLLGPLPREQSRVSDVPLQPGVRQPRERGRERRSGREHGRALLLGGGPHDLRQGCPVECPRQSLRLHPQRRRHQRRHHHRVHPQQGRHAPRPGTSHLRPPGHPGARPEAGPPGGRRLPAPHRQQGPRHRPRVLGRQG